MTYQVNNQPLKPKSIAARELIAAQISPEALAAAINFYESEGWKLKRLPRVGWILEKNEFKTNNASTTDSYATEHLTLSELAVAILDTKTFWDDRLVFANIGFSE